MTSRPNILIFGAGLIGLSTADALLGYGAQVTLIESRTAPMLGASHANSGMIHPSQVCSWSGSANSPGVDAAVFDLACQSWPLMERRMRSLGLEAMASRPAGCWQIFDTVEAAQAARKRLEARNMTVSDRSEGEGLFGRPALFFPDDHSGDARVYGEALASSIQACGGRIIANLTNIDLIEALEGGLPNLDLDDSETFDHIIVACGAGSNALLAPLGIHLPIEPVRGWAADFRKPDATLLPSVPVMDAQSRSALTLFEDRLRLSGTWGEPSVDPLLTRWAEIMPDIMARLGAPIRTWSGLRPVSALGRPIIGPTTVPRLWVNAGHGHMGWTLCAASGQLMADMIVNDVRDSRFALSHARAA